MMIRSSWILKHFEKRLREFPFVRNEEREDSRMTKSCVFGKM